MHPIDILFSTGMVLVFSAILFSGVVLIGATLLGHQRATDLVSDTIVSGRMQIICLLSLAVVAKFFDSYTLTFTAYATLYGGVVLCIVFTGFWMAARHARFTQRNNMNAGRRDDLRNIYHSPVQ